MCVGSGMQPSIGVGDVLDDNAVLRRWQPRAHALHRRPPTIGILRREQLDVSQLQRARSPPPLRTAEQFSAVLKAGSRQRPDVTMQK
jgi:hypothetical protein